jgi:hypothetical protein
MLNQLKKFQQEISLLADEVENDWQNTHFELSAFPQLAKEILDRYTPSVVPDIDSLLNEIGVLDFPQQTFPNQEFSNLPLTLARKDKFSIDIYIWTTSDTNIHDHHFCGAFKVIKGNSIQIDYKFTKINELGSGIDEGELQTISYKELPTNSTEAIELGSKFIHHVFHLQKPTITLCIRTNFLKDMMLNSYLYPKYRIKHQQLNLKQKNQLRLLELALSCGQFPGKIPFDHIEVMLMMYLSNINRLRIEPELLAKFRQLLTLDSNTLNFINILESQNKIEQKLKTFGLKD